MANPRSEKQRVLSRPPSNRGGAESRVLIVEDDLATLFALQRLFQGRGWQVGSSRTVERALGLLDAPFDWIVLDLALADGSGEDVLRRVRESRNPARVAVVSGMSGLADLPSVKALRPEVVMTKPIRFEDLLAACAISPDELGAGGAEATEEET